jgi:hypothetical protein
MSDKPPTPEEADLALVLTYLQGLQEEGFYGVLTITLNNGEVKHIREDKTRPAPALARELWDKLPERVKPVLEERFKNQKPFG